MAEIQHPVQVKSILSVRPPLQARGGALQELYKGNGDHCRCASFHDISLGNYNSKLVCRWVRTRLKPALIAMTAVTQFGAGLHGGDTNVTHLQLRTAFEIADAINKFVGILFLDIITAFATLARHLVLDVDAGDELWLWALKLFLVLYSLEGVIFNMVLYIDYGAACSKHTILIHNTPTMHSLRLGVPGTATLVLMGNGSQERI